MNVPTLLARTVERFPDRPALAYGSHRWTYAEWMARIRRFARALAGLGVRPSDRVAFYLTASEASVTTYFACQLLGAVAVPVNFRLAPAEVAYILQDSGACVLVYDKGLGEAPAVITGSAPTVRDLISCASDADAISPGHHQFEALVQQTADGELPGASPPPESHAALVYTSGTTGRPKGVMHSHGNDVAIAMNCVMEYSLSRRDIALHIAPLYHVGGLQAYFTPHVMVGATNIVLPRYDALQTLVAIERERVTTLFAVPTQIEEMLFHPRFGDFDLSSLRMITTGGAPIAAVIMQRVIAEMCANVFNGYGMTEASLALLLHPEEALTHLGSCGKPTLITDCRLVPHGAAPPGGGDGGGAAARTGELVVRGPQTMSGYWNNAAETARKIKDGWLYTGDVFSRDSDGFYTFRGRVDDLIVSGGENIYPREVEEVLYRCPGVKQAAVVGLPDPRWGSRVTAFIVRATPDLTAEAVDAFCRSSHELAAFKRPRQVVFVDRLPTNPSGKVIKRALMGLMPEGRAPSAPQAASGSPSGRSSSA
jgi:fatty-acyl-CoA synthase